jgi:hypothetical protein
MLRRKFYWELKSSSTQTCERVWCSGVQIKDWTRSKRHYKRWILCLWYFERLRLEQNGPCKSPSGISGWQSRLRWSRGQSSKAAEQPILVYDWATKSAWLVDELNLVLHMVLMFFRQPRIRERRHDDEVRPLETVPMLPYTARALTAAWLPFKRSDSIRMYTFTPKQTERSNCFGMLLMTIWKTWLHYGKQSIWEESTLIGQYSG